MSEKVTSVTCVRGEERTMRMTPDGAIGYTVTYDSAGDDGFAREWLLDNL